MQVHILVNDNYVIGEVRGKNESLNTVATTYDYSQAIIIKTKLT